MLCMSNTSYTQQSALKRDFRNAKELKGDARLLLERAKGIKVAVVLVKA